MAKIESVLFVCTGNLCRSPMAEGILKDRLARNKGGGIHVSSAGTWGLEGEDAASHAISVCRDRGIDISQHKARRLTEEMIQRVDLVVVMEFDHFHAVLEMCPDADKKTRMLTQFGDGKRHFYEPVPDPYGRSKRQYVKCFEQIEKHMEALFDDVLREKDLDS